MGRSKLAVDLARQKGVVGTMRNWRTVTTLLAMADEAAGLTWTSSCSTRSARCCAACCRRDLGELRTRHHRYGIKVWFGPAKPTREHYEAQVIGAKHVAEATVLAIEVGFHAEHRDPADNERALDAAARPARSGGARSLGPEAVAGEFIDDRHGWQRLSETWPDPDLGDPDLPLELATRLTDYITALEPLRDALISSGR